MGVFGNQNNNGEEDIFIAKFMSDGMEIKGKRRLRNQSGSSKSDKIKSTQLHPMPLVVFILLE